MKQSILIVEDHLASREVLTWHLGKIGDFEIREATNCHVRGGS